MRTRIQSRLIYDVFVLENGRLALSEDVSDSGGLGNCGLFVGA